MYIKQEKGAVTIFLSIIILIVMVLACILVDGARIRAGEIQVKRAAADSLHSVLAGYNAPVKKELGIFFLNENNPEKLRQEIKEYMSKALNIEKNREDGLVDLYGYQIEEIQVTPLFNLTENEVTRKQILEYMKYRAPKEALEIFWKKVEAVSDSGKAAEISEQKMQIDKLYMDIVKDQNNLAGLVKQSNKFSYKSIEKYAESYMKAVDEFRKYSKELDAVEKKIEKLISMPAFPGKTDMLEELYKKKADLEVQKEKAKRKKFNEYKLFKDYLKEYTDINEILVFTAKRLCQSLDEIKPKISGLKSLIKSKTNDNSTTYLKELSSDILNGISGSKLNIKDIGKNIPDKSSVEAVLMAAEKNFGLTSTTLVIAESFNEKYAESIENEAYGDACKVLRESVKSLSKFNNKVTAGKKISWAAGTNTVEQDNRANITKEVKALFKKHDDKDNPVKQNQKNLPSYWSDGGLPNKTESKDFSLEDAEYLKQYETVSNQPDYIYKNNITYNEVDKTAVENLGDEVGFQDNNFFTNAFDFMKNLGDIASQYVKAGLENVRDELYIDEYIIGTFSNAVPRLKDGTDTTLDLSGNTKKKTLDYEVEYILYGKKSENANLNLAKGEILLIRFAVDTINVYRDPAKIESALVISAASSAWSFGLAAPIVYNLVLCGWGMADAVNDLNYLMKGEAVPIFKKYEKIQFDKDLKFTYHDYLRIFLLLESPSKKLNRIEDLIQLKSGRKLSECNTAVRIEAVVSMKYLFMTQAFIPEKFKISDGSRHKFRIVLYQGY